MLHYLRVEASGAKSLIKPGDYSRIFLFQRTVELASPTSSIHLKIRNTNYCSFAVNNL